MTARELAAGEVLFEDDHIVVVAKPAGVLSDATRDPARDHMVAAVERWLGERAGAKPATGVRAVHRLDRDTSGVLILARTRAAAAALSAELAARRADKEYLALVAAGSRAITLEWTVSSYLLHRKGRTASVRAGGDPAETRFVLRARAGDVALLVAIPATGRTHQIRVHAAASMLPILGDPLYAPPAVRARAPRLCLHALAIEIAHPATGERMRFEAPLAADMQDVARQLGLHHGQPGSD